MAETANVLLCVKKGKEKVRVEKDIIAKQKKPLLENSLLLFSQPCSSLLKETNPIVLNLPFLPQVLAFWLHLSTWTLSPEVTSSSNLPVWWLACNGLSTFFSAGPVGWKLSAPLGAARGLLQKYLPCVSYVSNIPASHLHSASVSLNLLEFTLWFLLNRTRFKPKSLSRAWPLNSRSLSPAAAT